MTSTTPPEPTSLPTLEDMTAANFRRSVADVVSDLRYLADKIESRYGSSRTGLVADAGSLVNDVHSVLPNLGLGEVVRYAAESAIAEDRARREPGKA